mmetsp:Transcript_10290/g.17020  ORF Transcript_10290/g.17020 Transcript_10290/m.17020 type:complete len:512 (+) Transcript_10290:969-2504(+)
MVNWYAEMCAFGFAGLGASPFSEGNKSSSPSDNYENGTVIRGEALQLSQGPSKVPRAPHTPGFDAMLQHDQQTSSPNMNVLTMEMLFIAPILVQFTAAVAHNMPDVAEKALNLTDSWHFRCTKIYIDSVLRQNDDTHFGVLSNDTLDLFIDKIMNSAGAFPFDLSKKVDSAGRNLQDAMVEFAKSKSPDANLEGTPVPTPSVALPSTVFGSVAPTLDNIDHQPEPSPAPDIGDDIGTPPLDVRGDQPSSSDDDPKQPLLVHLPPALPHDLGPGPDDPDDTVQPLHICALPAPPTDDHLGFARLANGAHDDDSILEVSNACVASLQLPSSSSDNRDVLEHGFFYKATLDSSPDYYGDPTLLVTPYTMILPATAPLFMLAGGRPPDLHPRPGPATIRAPLHHGQLLHSTFAGPDIFYLQHGEMDIDDMFAASFSHDHFSSWYDDVVLHYLVASFLFICLQIPWLLILGPALLLITGPLTPTSWDFTNPSPSSMLHSSIQVFKPWLHIFSILCG